MYVCVLYRIFLEWVAQPAALVVIDLLLVRETLHEHFRHLTYYSCPEMGIFGSQLW